MEIIFKKEEGRSVSNKSSLKAYRGIIALDNGVNVHITPKYLKLTEVDFTQLEPVAQFTHLKPGGMTKRKVVYEDKLIKHSIYSISICGIRMLFERINDEPVLKTYKPQKKHGISDCLPKDALTFVRHTVAEEYNALTKLLDATGKTTFKLNKPKREGNVIHTKLSKQPIELTLTVSKRA